jgi:hypothetical protein
MRPSMYVIPSWPSRACDQKVGKYINDDKSKSCQSTKNSRETKRAVGGETIHRRPEPHVGSNARSLPFRIGGVMRSIPRVRGDCPRLVRVGVIGGDAGSPDAASARRNSTQRREKD